MSSPGGPSPDDSHPHPDPARALQRLGLGALAGAALAGAALAAAPGGGPVFAVLASAGGLASLTAAVLGWRESIRLRSWQEQGPSRLTFLGN